jgi:hypothetical protein
MEELSEALAQVPSSKDSRATQEHNSGCKEAILETTT